jgi:hypothetical protein
VTTDSSDTSPHTSSDDVRDGQQQAGENDGPATAAEIVEGRPFPTSEPLRSDANLDSVEDTENVLAPAKVMRIGSMVKQLLEEVRGTPLDEKSRERLAEIYERSIVGISSALSPDLAQELHELALPFKDGEVPSESELRVAKAQLVGWLEGLFHGIQATLFAQQFAARQQLDQMRQIPAPNMPTAERPGGTYI